MGHNIVERHTSSGSVSTLSDGYIAVIESYTFIRECIRRTVQSAFSLDVKIYSEANELEQERRNLPKLILLSLIANNSETNANVLGSLCKIAPQIPIIVLANKDDAEMAKAAISYGAKGFIPVTSEFEIAIEAMRFVLAGGTYVPIDYMFRRAGQGDYPPLPLSASEMMTARELAVVRAVQRGKSNKVIAYELGMCEGTVKVHLRRIMKKWNAKNRTDVAIKSQAAMSGFPLPEHLSCVSTHVASRGVFPTRDCVDPPAPGIAG